MANVGVIGAGPNGLAAGITLARAGHAVTVFERNGWAGGACSTREVTLPGFRHDLGSSAYPLGVASPFLRELANPVAWVEPPAACAHPLDDGTAVMLEHTIEATVAGLDAGDRAAYRTLLTPTVEHFDALLEDILGPILHLPRHPLILARFGVPALFPAATLARSRFKGTRARALFAGMAAHSVLPLSTPTSAAVALVLLAAGHTRGWPLAGGGAHSIADALIAELEGLGGRVVLKCAVEKLSVDDSQFSLEAASAENGERRTENYAAVLADVTPRQLLGLAGPVLPEGYRRRLQAFRPAAGAFKIDYALSAPIPWRAAECRRAATVHLGGTLEEIEASEAEFASDRPFCLLVQPSLFDPSRAPEGRHTAWVYCHVPNGSAEDWTATIERQLERFAPGFRECVLARKVWGPAELEAWNPNLVGGDVSGGAMDPKQLVFRPTPSLYRTGRAGLYLCGASTPPGGGVHGMAGMHAGRVAIEDLRA